MKSIFGWIGYSMSEEEAHSVLSDMQKSSGDAESLEFLIDVDSAIGLCGQGDSRILCKENISLAIIGNPRWTDSDLEVMRQNSDAEALYHAYAKYGKEMFRYLTGSFSLAVLDKSKDIAILAIDRIGQCMLSYTYSGNALVFANNYDALNAHPGTERHLNIQGIYDYLYFHVVLGESEFYHGWKRLPPGNYLLYEHGKIKVLPYWKMNFDIEEISFQERKDEFIRILKNSVSRCVEDEAVGAFLSGGTDSSTVVGILSEKLGDKVTAYSIGFDEERYDETAYAKIAAQHFGVEHKVQYITPGDVIDAIPKISGAYDTPYGNASAVPTYYCAVLAASDGNNLILGGDGGDELFGGNSRYAKQLQLEYYSHIPRLIRKGIIEPFLMNKIAKNLPFFDKLSRYIEHARIPMPQRLERYNLLRQIGIDRIFSREFMAQIDTNVPDKILSNIYSDIESDYLINHMLGLDLRITLADNDLPKVIRMCDLAGIDVMFPLLDDELVSFSGKIPPNMKVHGTELRYFFKKALSDFLPREVLEKKKHGFGLPFGVWLEKQKVLQQFSHDCLMDIDKRGIFEKRFLSDLISIKLRENSGYYGTLVWVIMMLEMWFKSRYPNWTL